MNTDSIYYKTDFPIEEYHTDLLNELESIRQQADIYQFRLFEIRWPSHENYFLVKDNIPIAESIAKRFKDMYNIDAHPRYYILLKGFELDTHVDEGTLAAFNYLISDENDPLVYFPDTRKININYKKGLVNLQMPHMVPKTVNERVLLKLSIYNNTFEECKEKILAYETSNIR